MRAKIDGAVPSGVIVLTCGSFARREASGESDLDFYCISSGNGPVEEISKPQWLEPIRELLQGIVPKSASTGGAFGEAIDRRSLLTNIGGNGDSNDNITRRMLLLLEGEWLSGDEQFKALRREMLARYIPDHILDHQLALFLLNDLIRYYRTMAVDYEYKTVEAEVRKPWGLRNIKLVFSRKLFYASGLFSVARTMDCTRGAKIDVLDDLFSLSVVERMERICGVEQFASVRSSYCYFLSSLEKKETRDHLNSLTPEQRDDETFRLLKNRGHQFTRELLKLFEATFDSTHPIRRAVVF